MTVQSRCGQGNGLPPVLCFSLSADEKHKKGFCLSWVDKATEKGEKMDIKITKEQINTTIALALMKHLFNQGKISEKVYKKILAKYGNKGLAELNN